MASALVETRPHEIGILVAMPVAAIGDETALLGLALGLQNEGGVIVAGHFGRHQGDGQRNGDLDLRPFVLPVVVIGAR